MEDDEAAVSPPHILYAMMGVWSTITGRTEYCSITININNYNNNNIYYNSGILGFLANLLAVFLFLKVGKVKSGLV